MKRRISSKKAPPTLGAYSQGIVWRDLIFTSAQLPIHPQTGDIPNTGIEGQTVRVLENLKAVLNAAHSSLDHVLKTTVYLSDMNHFAAFNEIYSCYFISCPPARSCVEVSSLPMDVLIQLEAVAYVDRYE